MTKDELAALWRWFADEECWGYSPPYEQVCAAVAGADDLLDRLLALPGHAHLPNMLLAAVHDLVLRGGAPELARRYDGLESDETGRIFVAVALEAWDDLLPTLMNRRTQTNEIGRLAILAPALAAVGDGDRPTVVDVGTSAGLTLAMDRCRIDYGPLGALGPADSPVRVECEVLHGEPPIRPTPVAGRIGLDRRPLDLTDPDDARWLLACTWPGTGRLERTRAAVALASAEPRDLRVGDAVADLPALLDAIDGPVVVTTTWVVSYLAEERRRAFSDLLADASRHRSIDWIVADGPGIVDALPRAEPPDVEGATANPLGVVTYQDGRQTGARLLAQVHPHGQWLWWLDEST